ncbi:SH3 domain-containing protein [Xylophilus sp. GW821-FHT01B05]
MHHSSIARLALAALLLPAAAQAQQAYTNTGVNLRAGPGASYPVVVQLAPSTSLNVQGCVAGYQWCDVVLPDGLRGWVYAQSLSYPYQGRPVPLAGYGATIGIPLVTFALGSYWGSYYRDRPWYGEPRYWGGRRPPPPQHNWHPPGRPPHMGGGGPGWNRPDRPHGGWDRPGGGQRPGGGHPGGGPRPGGGQGGGHGGGGHDGGRHGGDRHDGGGRGGHGGGHGQR